MIIQGNLCLHLPFNPWQSLHVFIFHAIYGSRMYCSEDVDIFFAVYFALVCILCSRNKGGGVGYMCQ